MNARRREGMERFEQEIAEFAEKIQVGSALFYGLLFNERGSGLIARNGNILR